MVHCCGAAFASRSVRSPHSSFARFRYKKTSLTLTRRRTLLLSVAPVLLFVASTSPNDRKYRDAAAVVMTTVSAAIVLACLVHRLLMFWNASCKMCTDIAKMNIIRKILKPDFIMWTYCGRVDAFALVWTVI